MIRHGILAGDGPLDFLFHEIKKNLDFDVENVSKKISWKKTHVFDNSNRNKWR